MLRFLGRGSAFADENNCAFFTSDNELVLLDCPPTAFHKIKKTKYLSQSSEIIVLVTHTHGDHSGGVGALVQYAKFALGKKVTVTAPSETVKNDLLTLLMRIEGCERDWFDIVTADELNKDWLVSSVATTHVAPLNGRCFGYHLKIDGKNVVFTGDTATLDPFLPLLESGDYLYTEISYYNSGVHLYINDNLSRLTNLANDGVNVYLMHLDDEEKIAEAIRGTRLKFAPLTDE